MNKKTPPPPPSDADLDTAAQSGFMRQLLGVADAFGRAGARGPFTVGLPVLTQGWVAEKKGYRKISILAGSRFEIDKITFGKVAGLLFCFRPVDPKVADKDHPEWIELGWDDVVNTFGDLADQIDELLTLENLPYTQRVNVKLKEIVKGNPAMHKILLGGFERALTRSREQAQDERELATPGWGAF